MTLDHLHRSQLEIEDSPFCFSLLPPTAGLQDSLLAQGLLTPLSVFVVGKRRMLFHGFRRARALAPDQAAPCLLYPRPSLEMALNTCAAGPWPHRPPCAVNKALVLRTANALCEKIPAAVRAAYRLPTHPAELELLQRIAALPREILIRLEESAAATHQLRALLRMPPESGVLLLEHALLPLGCNANQLRKGLEWLAELLLCGHSAEQLLEELLPEPLTDTPAEQRQRFFEALEARRRPHLGERLAKLEQEKALLGPDITLDHHWFEQGAYSLSFSAATAEQAATRGEGIARAARAGELDTLFQLLEP